ncbi:MAG: ABC transporter ATP-binding protein, partial [Wenzhouxiangella sp.]|nr:ABC transporter ATP-binding protein [Wenzhouxiangella sp.]
TSVKTLLGKLDVETFVLDLRAPVTSLPVLDGIELIERDPTTLEVSLPKSRSLTAVFKALDEHGAEVVSMRNKANRLEELFVRLVNLDSEEAA